MQPNGLPLIDIYIFLTPFSSTGCSLPGFKAQARPQVLCVSNKKERKVVTLPAAQLKHSGMTDVQSG